MAKGLLSILICMFSTVTFAEQDPTAPLGWKKPVETVKKKARTYPLPRLQSIVCQESNNCYAILNDKIIARGETLSGYYVKSVEKERVVLSRAGKYWNLTMFNTDIKK